MKGGLKGWAVGSSAIQPNRGNTGRAGRASRLTDEKKAQVEELLRAGQTPVDIRWTGLCTASQAYNILVAMRKREGST